MGLHWANLSQRDEMENFFNIDDPAGGKFRQLAEGLSTTIYGGDHAMVSIVRVEPHARGQLHDHPEEQWGICLRGGGTRLQGDVEVEVGPGDFWRTPGGVPHTVIAGPDGMLVADVFAPPRKAYEKDGSGFSD